MMNRVKAYIRLQDMKQKRNDLETFTNSLTKALNRFNDVDKALIVKQLNVKVKEEIEQKKQQSELNFLRTEKANDILKLV